MKRGRARSITCLAMIGLSLLMAACEGPALAILTNRTAGAVTVSSVAIHPRFASIVDHATVRPGRKVQYSASEALAVDDGKCRYSYAVPLRALSLHMGAVNPLTLGPDMRLYRQSGSKSQPTGWPLEAASRVCR